MKIDLESIRQNCLKVSQSARHVRIDYDEIGTYAGSLPIDQIQRPEMDPQCHYLEGGDGTAAFILCLDAVNFGSGFFPKMRKMDGMSGYFTVASSLTNHFRANGPMTADQLATISTNQCCEIFGQSDDPRSDIYQLMELFALSWNNLGNLLLGLYEGSFTALIDHAQGSVEKMLKSLVEMPFYRDLSVYHGLSIPFYKRAQLTVADLALAFNYEGWGQFDDLDDLTIFADNLVPHVLRVDGILEYSPELRAKIDAEEPLQPGSDEEIEIRACAVHAVECIKQHFHEKDVKLNAMQLDYLLWNRGQQPGYKAIPRHRARTVFY